MKRDRAVILSLTIIFMLWAEIFIGVNRVQAQELTPVEVILLQKELTVPEGEALVIIPLLEQSVGIHSYQWYKDGVELAGHTERNLEILSVTLPDAGEYKLVVTTTVGSESVQAESGSCFVTVSEVEKRPDSENGPEAGDGSGVENGPEADESGTGSGEGSFDTQQGGFPESPEPSNLPQEIDPSGETESAEVISTSVESGKKGEDEDLLSRSAGNNGILAVTLILILGMGALGVAFFVNKCRSEYLEE